MIHIGNTHEETFCKLPVYVGNHKVVNTSQVTANTTCIECHEAVELWAMVIDEKILLKERQ